MRVSLFIFLPLLISAQVDETLKRYVKVGSLQSHFSAYGSERAWNNTYYEGLIWPANYLYQDNSVIKRVDDSGILKTIYANHAQVVKIKALYNLEEFDLALNAAKNINPLRFPANLKTSFLNDTLT